jgi:flavin reductase (DIM6/NTAB) family NADH-FMN oxidoreductase RutF
MTFDSRTFRNAIGRFTTGVAIATCRAADGGRVGLTVNSFNSVSLDPPLVLFSIDRKARSCPLFVAAGHFAINILREDQIWLSKTFASADGPRWEGLALATLETGAPVLSEALATFDCRAVAAHDGGDHVIFVGQVLALNAAEGDPLLYFRGEYRKLATIRET